MVNLLNQAAIKGCTDFANIERAICDCCCRMQAQMSDLAAQSAMRDCNTQNMIEKEACATRTQVLMTENPDMRS